MTRARRTMGLGVLGGVLLSALVGFARPAAADVEVYFGPPSPPVYIAPAPPPPTWHQWGPGYYYYYDHGYYAPGWRHDGHHWRYEQGYWGWGR